MPPISLPVADFFYNVSNVALVVGATAILLGTIGAVWMGSVKERYGDERIKANEAQTASANEGAARANERAALLERDAENARLEQERLRQSNLTLETELAKLAPRVRLLEPRSLSESQSEILRQRLSFNPASVIVTIDGQVPDAQNYARQILKVFQSAGWRTRGDFAIGIGGTIAVSGLKLLVDDVTHLTEFEEAAAAGLRDADVEFDMAGERRGGPDRPDVEIIVTVKLR